MTLVLSIYSILRGPAVPMQFVHSDTPSMSTCKSIQTPPCNLNSLDHQQITLLLLPPTSPSPHFVESDTSSWEARVPRMKRSGRAALGRHISSLTVSTTTTSRSYDIAPPLNEGCGHVNRSATSSDAYSLLFY